MKGLLEAFQVFWRENAEILPDRNGYVEAVPQLVLQAFLQRVFNGNATIVREYATGRRNVDLCVTYQGRRYPIEVKLANNGQAKDEITEQILDYMDKCGSGEGWLVTFDRSMEKLWEEKIKWADEKREDGRIIHRVGC